MPRVLRVFDLSSYAHAGAVNKTAFFSGPMVQLPGGYQERDVPAGGISLLFNQIYLYFDTCDMVFCADRTPTIKQGMFPDYKASREHKRSIGVQKRVMEKVLEACDFTVLYEEGYEADDFMYSVVKHYYNEYDKIYVHVADSDLYLLVDDKVSINKTHSKSKDVSMENYRVVARRNQVTEYNTLSFLKVLYGDKKDDIPPLRPVEAERLCKMFMTPFMKPRMGDKAFMRANIEALAPWALAQFDLVYPLDTPVPDVIQTGNKESVKAFGFAMQNRHFPNQPPNMKEIDSLVEKWVDEGLYLD